MGSDGPVEGLESLPAAGLAAEVLGLAEPADIDVFADVGDVGAAGRARSGRRVGRTGVRAVGFLEEEGVLVRKGGGGCDFWRGYS